MNKPTLKSLTDMGNDENNLSDIHEKALQLMEHGADISDEQLDQLRADERLREACLDLQAATMAFREDHDDTDVDDELSRVHSRLESRAAERPLRRWWAAAAVALFLVAGGAWWVSSHRAPADNSDVSAYVTVLQGDDETRQVTLQTDERTTVLPSREHRQGGTATAAGTLEAARLQAETVKLTVPLGKTYRVVLADGSEVFMSPDSRLVFPTAFKGARREVLLEGEAYFRVAKDARHPFVVTTPRVTTTVLGTEFHVCCYDHAAATVTLVSGSVTVRPAANGDSPQTAADSTQEVTLKPGQQVSVADRQLSVTDVDTDPYTYRVQGFFYFDQSTLADIMKSVGKWYNMSVEFRNRQALSYKMRFIAEQDSGLNVVLQRLNSLEKFTVRQEGSKLIVE